MRNHVDRGLRERQVELLEAIAMALDADVAHREQCERCGQWFEQLSSHTRHCDGP